jgi:L-ascorbate metabolism protein UlaG (beta-lactamase superfamily)
MHYNTFPAIEQDLSEFKRAIELTTGMNVELLHPGNMVII